MQFNSDIWVHDPETPVQAFMNGKIPVIRIGDLGEDHVDLVVGTAFLSPTDQKLWLTRLAAAVTELAAQVEIPVVA